jgi:hypothetical protein
MIEIKVSNIDESTSRLMVLSGHHEVLHINVRRPIDEGTYYNQVAPILSPMVRADEGYMYVNSERLRMTVEPITGFMSCGGRSVVDIIQEIQRDGVQEGADSWSPSHALRAALEFEQNQNEIIEKQRSTLSQTNEDLLREQEVMDQESEDRKLEREIVGTRTLQKTMTPLQAARLRAAQVRKEI